MVVGFKLTSVTPENYQAVYDYVKSVTFLLEEDLLDILSKWKWVTIYSKRLKYELNPVPLDMQDGTPAYVNGTFRLYVYAKGVYVEATPPDDVPIEIVELSGPNILINNVESKLDIAYVDPALKMQYFTLGITAGIGVSDHARNQLKELERKRVIRYMNETSDFLQDDFYSYDFTTN